MPKAATNWSPNPTREAGRVGYNALLGYNSAATRYSGINTALVDKNPTDWAGMLKNATNWSANSNFDTALTYEPSGVTYDTIYSVYDGVSGQSPIGTKNPTDWSPV